MQTLKEILDSALVEAKFDIGKVNMPGVSTTYSQDPMEVVSPADLRDLILKENRDEALVEQAQRAQPIIPKEKLEKVSSHVTDLLGGYVDEKTGMIGLAFPFGGSQCVRTKMEGNGITIQEFESSVTGLAEALVRGAAILGSERLAKLFSCWVESDSITYRTFAVVDGLYLEQTLNPLPGITLAPLPQSTDGDFGSLPVRHPDFLQDYLGRTVLSINTVARPTFFRPGAEDSDFVVKANYESQIGMDTVCYALALESERFVEPVSEWNDYNKVSQYLNPPNRSSRSRSRGGPRALSSGFSVSTSAVSGATTLSIREQNISVLSEEKLGGLISSVAKNRDKKVDMAISRWRDSNESFRGMANQFVDLRIVMESLYMRKFKGDKNQEMSFRLAHFGAWHLGSNFEERKEIRDTLKRAYGQASRAVHDGQVQFTEDNRQLLLQTQVLCRRGILKLLQEGEPKDWGDIVLGSGLEGELKQ